MLPRRLATLLSKREHIVPGKLIVSELFFSVPLDHSAPDAESITLFARSVAPHDRPAAPSPQAPPRPYLVYLEGGPGFGNLAPQDHFLTRPALDRGYQVLFLDYRGTGLSTPVAARSVVERGDADAQARYLSLFRQDSIVADLEAVRRCLTAGWPDDRAKWSLFGQSFGGFVALTYLSFAPEGVREAFLTGGLAPILEGPDVVYAATYARLAERNRAYYARYPEDAANIRRLVVHLEGGDVALPAGGTLTPQRLLSLGISLGKHGGAGKVHGMILRLVTDLDQVGYFRWTTLADVEAATCFDDGIIYAILHEAIYCHSPGVASNWSAMRVGKTLPEFRWLESPSILSSTQTPHMSGEMVYPFHFSTNPELTPLGDAAEILARRDTWPALYDPAKLAENDVPVYAASYVHDMYVDSELARSTAAAVKGMKVWESSVHMHNAVRVRTGEVLGALWRLRDEELD